MDPHRWEAENEAAARFCIRTAGDAIVVVLTERVHLAAFGQLEQTFYVSVTESRD